MNMMTRVGDFESVFAKARKQARQSGRPVLAVLAFPWSGADPMALYQRLETMGGDCLYWETREPELVLLGIGRALECVPDADSGLAGLQRRWRRLNDEAVIEGTSGARAIGGLRFDQAADRHWPWRRFPDACLTVPRLLLECTARESRLICHKLVRQDDDPVVEGHRYRRDIETLLLGERAALSSPPAPTLIREQGIGARQWQAKAETLIAAIRAGRMNKVVLARHLHQTYSERLSAATVLRRLRDTDSHSHLFAVRHGGLCFLGATPERLVSVNDGRVETHALAGTVRRGSDPEADQRLGEQLLASAKDRHEHEWVVQAIRDALRPLLDELRVSPEPVLHRLPVMQHLSTRIEGRVAAGAGVLELVEAMQPTPAVAGYPKHEALACIRVHEGFDRGWYAGPLGWIDGAGNGDFVVALRSALISGRECHLFAGCGLVADSVPEQEYGETSLKLSCMQRALAGDGREG
ncbi:Salicylate biosynthesis isochorismate synthase [Alloalcanivorax dieselolei B5]|uniref:isochorismate synthase n=1 Tax=Alcanivorax dieselolei (strain DSM 16502 / CGMCC 1.3690 / MCCC 1A00001 / B-5) TaxID=930169 RepID=K0CDW9_ALCDB|nr:isochorismate synthase [Alloalcanivorax dieselolei]AFT70773.1 Salicylate biosynthesis isochorismate synthase [Alloalcanivorax dieselolei B5]GGJ97634.1 salicylate biosynthesis isochorismate synthase [Alloalcanivorax dieselolei]